MKLDKILKMVEIHVNMDISSKRRDTDYVFFRSIYYKLCTELTPYSLAFIGKTVNRTHATVIHGLKIFNEVQKNDIYRDIYISCYNKLEGSKWMDDNTIKMEEMKMRYEKKINNLEKELMVVRKNTESPVIQKLLSLDEKKLEFFNKTRLVPFLKMNNYV